MITLSLTARQKTFNVGEPVDVQVSVENTSSVALVIPDFVNIPDNRLFFELQTPNEKIYRLEYSGLVIRGIDEPIIDTYRLAANSKYTGTFKVSDLASFNQTGPYYLTVMMTIEGVAYTSSELLINMQEAHKTHINIATGLSINQLNIAGGEAAYIAEGKTKHAIYTFEFSETAQNIGEITISESIMLHAQAAPVDEVYIPQNNATVMGELFRWIVWRSGNIIYAENLMTKTPLQWQAPEAIGRIIHRVHKIHTGPVEIALLSETGDTLWLLDALTDIELKWQLKLPIIPDEILVAIPAQSLSGPHHLILLEQQDTSYRLHHATYDAKGAEAFKQLDVMKGKAVLSIQMATIVDEKQAVTVASIAAEQKQNGVKLSLIETRHNADGTAEIINTIPLGQVDSLADINTGVLAYSGVGGKNKRLDLLISYTDGSIKKLSNQKLQAVSIMGKPTEPLQIISGGTMSYILYYDISRGYYFEPI